jgi:hypothetical protein
MTYTAHKSNVRTIKQNDPDFYIHDGLQTVGRAVLTIHAECPESHAIYIHQALSRGYISLTSNVKDNELVWETLSK